MPGNSKSSSTTPSLATSAGHGRGGSGNGRCGGDLHMAMSTCAGCGAALDSFGGQANRKCPYCKRGESVEGRHFYCSKECFASSWAVHKELHVRKERTINFDFDTTDSFLPPGHFSVAGLGFMSDVE